MTLIENSFMQKSKDASGPAKTEGREIVIDEGHLFGHPKFLHEMPLHLIKLMENSGASVEDRSVFVFNQTPDMDLKLI